MGLALPLASCLRGNLFLCAEKFCDLPPHFVKRYDVEMSRFSTTAPVFRAISVKFRGVEPLEKLLNRGNCQRPPKIRVGSTSQDRRERAGRRPWTPAAMMIARPARSPERPGPGTPRRCAPLSLVLVPAPALRQPRRACSGSDLRGCQSAGDRGSMRRSSLRAPWSCRSDRLDASLLAPPPHSVAAFEAVRTFFRA